MNQSRPTGLGDAAPFGKRSLFKPPAKEEQSQSKRSRSQKADQTEKPETPQSPDLQQRIRTTMEITKQAMAILQGIQNRHRLETGKSLPLWKVVSRAIVFYGEAEKGEG